MNKIHKNGYPLPNLITSKTDTVIYQNFKCKITETILVMSLKYAPATKSTLCLILLINHAPLTYSGQASKNTLRYMILTYLWPWNKVKVFKPDMNC